MSNIKHYFKQLACISLFLMLPLIGTAQITFSAKIKPAREVLQQIEKVSKYRIFYNQNLTGLSTPITVEANNSTIEAVMSQISQQIPVSYTLKENFQIILTNPSTKAKSGDEDKPISGTVVDEKGEPVIGANVSVKGTTNGTITDIDGRFELSATNGSTLLISYIGYSPKEITVGNQSNYSISISEDTQALDEVVVVGYGTQKKVNLTGAVSSVNYDQELANRPITNASQALSGKISGVWVSQNSGKPGSDGAQMRIRGWGTLNNTNPLVLIDGVEGEFNQVNPNDIESISVLKDAASAAIYGSKAANGVILITTKMGKTNEETQVSLSSYFGIQSLGMHYDLINSSAESMEMTNIALENGTGVALFPDYMIENFRTNTDKYKYPSTDWFKEMFKNSLMHEHNVSIKGGTNKSTSFLSFNYMNQEGMIPNTESQRIGVRANLDFKVNTWFKIGGRLNYQHKVSTEPYDLSRVYTNIRGATPYIAPFTRDGRYGSVEAITNDNIILYDNRNPLIESANGQQETTADDLSVNLFAQADITKWLNLQATWSTLGGWDLSDTYNQSIFGYTDSGIEMMTLNFNREGIEMRRGQTTSLRNNFFTTANFNKDFGNHSLAAVAGIQMETYNSRNVLARRTSPPKEGLTQVDAGTDGIQSTGNMVALNMFSYFGRINYSFNDRYLFEANLRADASSRFKKGNRWGIFPGFSGGWRLSEEEFIKDTYIFDNLKLRASWGQLGNQNISGYWPYLTVVSQNFNSSYNYKEQLAPGAAITALVDENITWETTSSLDLGIDMGFLNNRLNIEADYFQKRTTDILVQLPVPRLLGGVSAPFENLGEMQNNGFELTVNYANKMTDRNSFSYSFSGNVTYVNNKVTKFQPNSPDQLYLIRDGYPYKTLYGYKMEGIYQSDTDASNHMANNGFKPKAGMIKYEDQNNDGKLDYLDKQEIGNTIPKFTYGLTTNLAWKGFDLSLLFQGSAGSYLYDQGGFTRMDYELRTICTFWRDAWTPENSSTKTPALRFNNSWDRYESSFWVNKADHIKLRNVQLGYSVSESLTKRFGLQKLYFYTNAQNVFTLMFNKDYRGFDPERDTFGDGQGVYPIPRIISFGLNLIF